MQVAMAQETLATSKFAYKDYEDKEEQQDKEEFNFDYTFFPHITKLHLQKAHTYFNLPSWGLAAVTNNATVVVSTVTSNDTAVSTVTNYATAFSSEAFFLDQPVGYGSFLHGSFYETHYYQGSINVTLQRAEGISHLSESEGRTLSIIRPKSIESLLRAKLGNIEQVVSTWQFLDSEDNLVYLYTIIDELDYDIETLVFDVYDEVESKFKSASYDFVFRVIPKDESSVESLIPQEAELIYKRVNI